MIKNLISPGKPLEHSLLGKTGLRLHAVDAKTSRLRPFPVSTGIGPQSLSEWAFRVRPGLWQICLCPKVAQIAEHKFANRYGKVMAKIFFL